MTDILFYCGINECQWNHHPVNTGPYAVVSPVYGTKVKENRVAVPDNAAVMQDSGAFCDGPEDRLDYAAALRRQLEHSDKWGYSDKIIYRASYDLLIDETWDGQGNREKRRWTESAANEAVEITVNAARYMRDNYDGPCVLSAQGVTARQYLECVRRVISIMDLSRDILGFGGWCIIGKMPRAMMPVLRDTIDLVIPYAAKQGVKKIHIWGVIYPKALGPLLRACDDYGIQLSTDSAGPQMKPCMGSWGYGEWRNNHYEVADPAIRGLERARHVELTRQWLSAFRRTKYYVQKPNVQPRLFEVSA